MPDSGPAPMDRRTVLAAMGGLIVAVAGAPSVAGALTSRAANTSLVRIPCKLGQNGLAEWADNHNGQWLGAWADDAGRIGTSTFDCTIVPAKRAATVAFAASGNLFGAKGVPRETWSVEFTKADQITPSFSGTSSQLGYVRFERQNTWSTILVTTSPPKGSKRPQSQWYADLHDTTRWTLGYLVTDPDGSQTRGSAAWARDRRPSPPSPTAYSTGVGYDSAYITGAYASKLLDAAAVRQALGADASKPIDNGGTASFTPVIGSSNSRVSSSAYTLQFSVLRGKTEADAQTFFAGLSQNDLITELAPDAVFSTGKLFVRRGREIAEIEVTANQSGSGTIAGARAAAIVLGQSIAPKLDQF